ncbi:sensor histidine kinase [Pedobacter frigoris]|uniref:sensor histidine kinase n=1 Tax=Pedobacter frigoris TaxID=2571272 RepID=UPI002930FE81|nr:histidine kinase [Pedobacter frigoris]
MKITLTLLLLSLLVNFSKAQQKNAMVDQYGSPLSYYVSSLQSKINVSLKTDKYTKSIIPFNPIPHDSLGTMVYLEKATTVNVTTQVKKDSLSYYRYSIFENDTTVVQSNAKLSKVDFVWPDRSDYPGYLTMNFGISNIQNKKITIKIYRLPEENKVTTLIIYNKEIKPVKFTNVSLWYVLRVNKRLRSHGYDPLYINEYGTIDIKNGVKFVVNSKTRAINLIKKKTDLDFVYHVILKNKSKGKENIVYFSNEWSYNGPGGDLRNSIPASHFNVPGDYELIVAPMLGRADGMTAIDVDPVKYTFTVLPPPVTFSTAQVATGFMILVLILSLVFYIIRKNNKKKLLIANRQAELAKSELSSVRSQLNPHFVFNALAGIQNLMNQNEVEKANGYLSKFARLTRNILDGKQLIALKDEHKLLEDYLAMERLRFNFNYEIRTNLEPDTLEVMIPTMLLQPFLENAVKHSMAILGEKGTLLVEFKSVDKDLILSIKDNGKGFDTQKVHEGLGLSLCKKRIDLLNQVYNECPITMDLSSRPDGTTVIIKLNNWL